MAQKHPSPAPRDVSRKVAFIETPLFLGGVFFVTLVLWASAFVAIPIALESVAPIPMITTRLLIATIFLFPVLVRDWSSVIRPRIKQDYPQILVMAGAGIFLYLLFLTYGQRTVGAGQTSLIINLTPLTTGFLAAYFLKEAFHKRMIYGALVSLLGVSLLVLSKTSDLFLNFDAVLILLAMFSSSAFYIAQRKLSKYYRAETLAAFTIVGGTILFLPLFPGTLDGLVGMTDRSAMAILYLGTVTILPYIGWAFVTTRMPVGKASLYLYTLPVIATGLGWLILDEAVTLNFVFAGLLIILGVMIGTGTWRQLGLQEKPRRNVKTRTTCSDTP